MSAFRNDREVAITMSGDLEDRATEQAKIRAALAPSRVKRESGTTQKAWAARVLAALLRK
jgi:hypothetical protein